MNRQTRVRRIAGKLLVVALAGLWIGAAGVAMADHDRHGDHCSWASRASSRSHGRHQAEYACRPCSQSFESRRDFHRHVRHHHHVPPWALPFVIVHHALGWVFYG
jgi:hypothetical protein